MTHVVYRVALVATLAALTALLAVALPQGYAQEAPPAPLVEGFPVPQDEDQAQNLEGSIAKGCSVDNLFEDLSCKGPEYEGYELFEEESEDSSSLSSTDCFVADVTEVSEIGRGARLVLV